MSGCVLKGCSCLGSHIPSTHKSTPPPCGVLRVMLIGDMAIWHVCAAKKKKISTYLLVIIILVCYQWHMWTVQLWDDVSGKNIQFPGLPTGLRQKGHSAVKLSASIKSCKMSNNIMYNRTISNRDGLVPNREKVRCGPIQTTIQQPHQVCKICKLRESLWNVGTMHGWGSEVVETLGRRRINICCDQESRWKGCSARLIWAKGFKYKFIWIGDNSGWCSALWKLDWWSNFCS